MAFVCLIKLILELIFYLNEHSSAGRVELEQFHRKASICCNRLIVCMQFSRIPFFNSFSSRIYFLSFSLPARSNAGPIVDRCAGNTCKFSTSFYGLKAPRCSPIQGRKECLIREKLLKYCTISIIPPVQLQKGRLDS